LKSLRVHEGARLEARQAADWYFGRSVDVARRFTDELLAGFSNASAAPLRYSAYLHGTRRILLKRFPYFIVFFDWQDETFVVAIAHAKRRSGYWRDRV
jgi:plasmid stabilization system protein ParE